jgi:hypothetical protein
MGTNFYIKDKKGKQGYHIGKRSAAGYYCFDCDAPLNNKGLSGVHDGYALPLDNCPVCGKKKEQEELSQSSAGLELGFNKDPYQKKNGVHSASSFNFAMSLEELKKKLSHKRLLTKCVIDEYGTLFTYSEFMKILDACPIHFTNMIGDDFS